MANAAPASSQMPTVPPISTVHGTMPGVERNMPMTAQNTASCVTRGLVSAMYWETRLPGVWEMSRAVHDGSRWRGVARWQRGAAGTARSDSKV